MSHYRYKNPEVEAVQWDGSDEALRDIRQMPGVEKIRSCVNWGDSIHWFDPDPWPLKKDAPLAVMTKNPLGGRVTMQRLGLRSWLVLDDSRLTVIDDEAFRNTFVGVGSKRGGAVAARRAHNPEVGGASPPPAT